MMSDLESRFSVNERDVIAESVEGETLIINLNSGAYYSSDGAGDLIWNLLTEGLTVQEVIERLGLSGPGSESSVESVRAFVRELQAEDLIFEDSSRTQASPEASAGLVNGSFVAPQLHKYTDFADLLMLDPIHEVHEATGWPTLRPADQA
jgi:hypothetical protein